MLNKALAAFAVATTIGTIPAQAAFDPHSPTVLITGSNRGIGLALTERYGREDWNIIATARSPAKADALLALQARYPKIAIEQLDVTDHLGIEALAERYNGHNIDILINNAAVLGDLPSQTVGGLDYALFEQVMAVNVYGPLKVAEAFANHVQSSTQKKIVSLTSGLGSITFAQRMGGFYYYRMSKAALNMGMQGLRADLSKRGIIVSLVSPGMVDTQLLRDSGYRGKSLTTQESADGLYEIIAALTDEDKGQPINVDGSILPW
jgi:NAD(P)-dependent dehydrogenase (short-subunit alcohol dehydrogenase family)